MFRPDLDPLEIVVRGTVVYLFLFILLRATKRQAGALGITDVLMIVLIADAAQNAMAGQYTSVSDGILLVATIAFWAYALDWLGFHSSLVERLIHPAPRELISNGTLNRRNMREELVTLDELMSQIRAQGLDDIGKVKSAFVEGDGQVTVIKADGDPEPRRRRVAI